MQVQVYNQEGKATKKIQLPVELFGVEVKPSLINQVVETQRANKRQVLAHTKGRSDVRGGGRKPWRQKGTGRARHGSIRSPLWKGGGVTFGPTKARNYSKKINYKVKRLALKMVLSNKAATEHLIILDNIKIKEAKTKLLRQLLNQVVGKEEKLLLALDNKDEAVITAAGNIPHVTTLPANSLNVLDLLKSPYLVTTEKGIKQIVNTYQ